MQKKLLCLILFLLLVALFPSFVNAQISYGTNSATRLKQQRQELKAQKKAAISQIKETVTAKREEFKARLATIRDQKKKALVDRIDTKLMNVNIKHTDRFSKVLTNLQILLDKISQNTDVTQAQAAIDAAKTAVANQAAKAYIITISSEKSLRSDVGAVTSQLRQDLMATHKLVVDAKQAVQSLKKDNLMKKEATRSANL